MGLQCANAVGEVAVGRGRFADVGLAIAALRRRGPAVHRFGGKDGVDRRIWSFQYRGEPRHFGGHVVDTLAQERVLHPLGRPVFLGLALNRAELAGEPVALKGTVKSAVIIGGSSVGLRVEETKRLR